MAQTVWEALEEHSNKMKNGIRLRLEAMSKEEIIECILSEGKMTEIHNEVFNEIEKENGHG